MSGKLLLKAMVLGTMAFSISTIGMAAEIQDVNGLDSASQTIASNAARKEAVRSSWMDRTDVVIGVGMKILKSREVINIIILSLGKIILLWGLLINPNLQNLTSYTLRHYNL